MDLAGKTDREKQILQGIVDVLKRELDPVRIILFGSRAKNDQRLSSDFDIAVDCQRPIFSKELDIKNQIESLLGLYELDLIYLSAVDENFRNIILKTGTVIYER